MAIREQGQAMSKEYGLEIQGRKFSDGFPVYGRVGAVFIREEFELIEMDERIPEHEALTIAPCSLPRRGTREIGQGKTRQDVAFVIPNVSLELSAGSSWSMNGYIQ